MSLLMEILKEEYNRLARQKTAYEKAIRELPRGYISKKIIKGREVYYLQHREGKKIISKYISAANLPEIESQIRQRKRFEESLKRVAKDRKRLEKVLDIRRGKT